MIAETDLPTVEGMHVPFDIPGCHIERVVEQDPDVLIVQMRQRGASGRCPDCGNTSRSIHSRYHRHPSDLPLVASRTVLRMEVRRFYCCNPSCDRRTFAGAPSEFLRPRARRTRRLAEAQGRVGIACGGAGGARLLTHLRMPASRATVLRLIRAMPMADAPSPIHISVDDWAMKKSYRYGTIVVDLDRHRVIDLLPDRTATTLAGWLEGKPDIRVVARDRATEYARGVSLGAPRALQVPIDGTSLLTSVRPSNDGSIALTPGSGAYRPYPDRWIVRLDAITPSHAACPSLTRERRAGRDGGPSTMKCGIDMRAARRCSGSPASWGSPAQPSVNTLLPIPYPLGCPTGPARASSIHT